MKTYCKSGEFSGIIWSEPIEKHIILHTIQCKNSTYNTLHDISVHSVIKLEMEPELYSGHYTIHMQK